MDYNIKKNIDKIKNKKATFFLDPLEYKLVTSKLRKEEYQVYNVYEDADKKILYYDKVPEVVLFKINTKGNLRHQDILGALFSLNIDSSIFGDIVIDNDNYYIYVLKYMADYFKNNLCMIGTHIVSLEEIPIETLSNYQKRYEIINIIVPSTRIDVVIARLIGTSRRDILDKISNKEVVYNYGILKSGSMVLKENDVFSIRRYGKYKFNSIVKNTHKGNYVIEILRYI